VRVLFASTQGAGHFGPLVPFLEACLRQGHEVLVVGPPTLDSRGYPFRPGAVPPEEELRPVWDSVPRQPPAQGEVIVVGHIFAGLNVRAMLEHVGAAIEEWRPDLVLREPSEYASAIAAEIHGVPHARIATGLTLVEEGALAFAAPALDDARPGVVQAIAESPYLTCWPGSADHGQIPAHRFSDPTADIPGAPLPDWWPGDERPLVYVTFGSVSASFPPAAAAYPKALEATGGLDARVLLTTGAELELPPAPANVHVERWVAQADVLGSAAVVVGHGGSGTTLGALSAGLPLVVTPLFADQPFNAARVAIVGAGVVSSLDGIRRSVERILAQGAFRIAALRIADEMRRQRPIDEFLEVALGG
jgi:Erythromycin biosynthesis protein CIII-like, C-terminal domain/Erythromycin biosynthesis protein CIII-like, N-terminal domain